MKFLLDTNAISDERRTASRNLNHWIAGQVMADLAISSITLLELEFGIRRKERTDATQGAMLRLWFETVKPTFHGRILSVDSRVAVAAAALQVPDPMPELDALIAATAIVNDLVLVTRNERDMARTGVRILNPW